MRLGQNLTDSIHGACEVVGITPLTYTLRDAEGKRHMRKRPGAKKWRLGSRCLVIPDGGNQSVTCEGVVLELEGGRPHRVLLIGDPVWDGAIVERKQVYAIYCRDVQ